MEKKVLNSKVSIIDKDGLIYMMGRSNESKTHVTYLIKYLEDKYGADTSKLKSGLSRKIYGYIFGKLGSIIYFNDGLTGMFYFPSIVTDEQEKVLKNLDLGYQKIAVCYSPFKLNNDIDYKMLGLDGEHCLKDVLAEYFIKQNNHLRRWDSGWYK